MASLTLKSVPSDLHRRLKARARANRRSLSAEVIACLRSAVLAEPVDAEALLSRAQVLRRRIAGHLSDKQLARLKSQGRP